MRGLKRCANEITLMYGLKWNSGMIMQKYDLEMKIEMDSIEKRKMGIRHKVSGPTNWELEIGSDYETYSQG